MNKTTEDSIIDLLVEIPLGDWYISDDVVGYECKINGKTIIASPSHGNNLPYFYIDRTVFGNEKGAKYISSLHTYMRKVEEVAKQEEAEKLYKQLKG